MMDILAILALVAKGVTVIQALYEAGKEAAPAIEATINLIRGARNGTLSQEDIAATEALLDQMVADFNLDLPPAQPGDPDYVAP